LREKSDEKEVLGGRYETQCGRCTEVLEGFRGRSLVEYGRWKMIIVKEK
jgi:hypothetical protein